MNPIRFLLFALLVLVAPTSASGCSCLEIGDALSSACRSDAVFLGKLQGERRLDKFFTEFTFSASKVYKGDVGSEVQIVSRTSGGACGRTYGAVGEEWLIYASDRNEGLRDSLCSDTKSLVAAGDDLRKLEKVDVSRLSDDECSRFHQEALEAFRKRAQAKPTSSTEPES